MKTKVNGLESGLLRLVGEEEVLGLEITVHHAHGVAHLDDADDDPGELRRLPLGVVPLLDDPVEQLAAGAELHDEVHGDGVLVGAPDGDHVGVAGEVVHYLDLAADVLDVVVGDQLPLQDGLAGELLAGGALHAQVRRPELPLPELPPQAVLVLETLRLALQHRADEQPGAGDALHRRHPRPRPGGLAGVRAGARLGGVLLGGGGVRGRD
ncbi:Os03g0788550, partial [Oryza sativa Japonica Group]